MGHGRDVIDVRDEHIFVASDGGVFVQFDGGRFDIDVGAEGDSLPIFVVEGGEQRRLVAHGRRAAFYPKGERFRADERGEKSAFPGDGHRRLSGRDVVGVDHGHIVRRDRGVALCCCDRRAFFAAVIVCRRVLELDVDAVDEYAAHSAG